MAKAAPSTTTAPFTSAPFAGPAAGAGAAGGGAASSAAAAGGGVSQGKGAAASWGPAIATIVLAPALTWAVGSFVLIPQLQKKLGAPLSAEVASEPAASSHGAAAAPAKGGGPTFEFQNVVVNLAGTMGTRYLKTTFIVTGTDANIRSLFEGNKAKLTDVTLNVLSSLSLADLEEPGAKNVLREKLVAAYNQTLGRKVAEQVYFSDFVVQ